MGPSIAASPGELPSKKRPLLVILTGASLAVAEPRLEVVRTLPSVLGPHQKSPPVPVSPNACAIPDEPRDWVQGWEGDV